MLADSHCHLNYAGLVEEQGAVIDRARAAGVTAMLNISTRVAEWDAVIAVAEREGAKVFHAGTLLDAEGKLRANGGRVLNVTAGGATVREAQAGAYAAVNAIDFAEGFCRRDIGAREVEREKLSDRD